MVDTSYNIRTKSSGELQIPFNTGSPNNWTRGETATFTFEFEAEQTFASDYTVPAGETQTFESLYVPEGVTLTIESGATVEVDSIIVDGTVTGDGQLITDSGMLTDLVEYAEWGGSWSTMTMLNNVVKYRTQIPSSAGIDSLVWGIEPNQDLQDRNVVGVWGLVESINNERNQPLTTNRYSVDVTVLAPLDEYATISDVESDLVI